MTIAKKFKINFALVIFCLIISFSVNGGCHTDYDSEDYEPLRGGGGSSTCSEEISWPKFLGNTLGLYIFGYVAHQLLSSKEIKENQ